MGVLAQFSYDNFGRRTALTRGNGQTTSYSYDAASRLATLVQNLDGSADDRSLEKSGKNRGHVPKNRGHREKSEKSGTRTDFRSRIPWAKPEKSGTRTDFRSRIPWAKPDLKSDAHIA